MSLSPCLHKEGDSVSNVGYLKGFFVNVMYLDTAFICLIDINMGYIIAGSCLVMPTA